MSDPYRATPPTDPNAEMRRALVDRFALSQRYELSGLRASILLYFAILAGMGAAWVATSKADADRLNELARKLESIRSHSPTQEDPQFGGDWTCAPPKTAHVRWLSSPSGTQIHDLRLVCE